MKRITEYRKLFNIEADVDLATLKTLYRNLIKEWHPDKFIDDNVKKEEAELKSKQIIEAYHFLVSISPETHVANEEVYTLTTANSAIEDLHYKNSILKITFQDGSAYEYFGVPKNIYNNLVNSANMARFARRHIYNSYVFRNVSKTTLV